MGVFFNGRGVVRVELARDVVCPGDVLVGTVSVRVDKPIKAARLKLLVSGQEIMMWKRLIAASTVYHSKTKDHVHDEIILVGTTTPFPVGETTYGFSTQLPVESQPSFSYAAKQVQDLDNVSVNTEHKIEAVLEIDGFGTSNLKGHAVFTVEPSPHEAPQPHAISTRHAGDVAFLSVFKRETCELSLDVATDVFVPSSIIEAHVGLTLDSVSSLKYLKLVLYEDAVVNRRDAVFKGLKSGSRVVASRRVEPSELRAATDSQYLLTMPISPNEVSNSKPLTPTMKAHFLTVTYRLAVECHLSMARRVCVDAPVTMERETRHVPEKVGLPLADMAIEATKSLVSAIAG